MKLGMFSPEISRNSVEELFEAIHGYGFDAVQFSFGSICDGNETPEFVEPEMIDRIIKAAKANDVEIVAVNGTFNMAHPDKAIRLGGLKGFEFVCQAAQKMGAKMVTLCTGTRNTDFMWFWHDDNTTQEAWDDCKDTLVKAIEIAEKYDVYLGIECEARNIVRTPDLAVKMFGELKSDRLKIVMDPANLFLPGYAYPEKVCGVLKHGFDLLGDRIMLAHGKDIKEGPDVDHTCAGKGIVDFDFYFEELKKYPLPSTMIIHGLQSEDEFPASIAYMQEKMKAAGLRG